MNRIQNIFKIGTFSIAGVFGVQLFGLEFAISFFILLAFLSIVDVMVGYYIAYSRKIVSSRIGTDGLFKKCVWLFLVSGGIFFLGNMAYVVSHPYLTMLLSAVVLIIIGFRVIFEVVSLVENIAIISTTEERNTLDWIAKILIGIVGISQKQIEKKIERYQE